MAFELVESKLISINKKSVSDFLNHPAAERDRTLSKRRMAYLRRELEAGRFKKCDWALVFIEDKNITLRGNGHHSATMLSRLEKIPPKLKASVDEYYCETMNDFADLYGCFDTSNSVRSITDTLRPHQDANPRLRCVSAQTLNLITAGIGQYFNNGAPPRRLYRDQKAELAVGNVEFVEFYNDLAMGMDSKHMRRSSVVAALYGGWKRNRGDAAFFWISVRDGEDLKRDDPARLLRDFLLTHNVGTGIGARGMKPVTPYDMFLRCVFAWNAYRAKKPLKIIKVPKKVGAIKFK